MDSLDHCFCMFQVETKVENIAVEMKQASRKTEETGSCTDTCTGGKGVSVVRRVDLIVTPPKQLPFALLGWTGSKVQNIIYGSLENISIKQPRKVIGTLLKKKLLYLTLSTSKSCHSS